MREPGELFSAGTHEVAGLFSTVEPPFAVTVIRFDPGPEFVLAGASTATDPPIGARWRPTDFYVSTRVHRTGGSARVDAADVQVGGREADTLRRQGFLYQVGSPIVVEDRLWGAITTNSAEPLAPDADQRLEKFTELVATAIANTEARAEVERLAEEQAALRRLATLVAEGPSPSAVMDAAAAEMERALGADASMLLRYEPDEEATVLARRVPNQRALSPGTRISHAGDNVTGREVASRRLPVRRSRISVRASERREQGNRELRELAHGIMPAVLTRGGLRAGVGALVSRLDLQVEVDVPAERLPAETETSAYFIVAEALTNVVKHAHAERVEVTASLEDGALRIEVRGDGAGGADPDGHGLVGMRDRVTTLGGRLEIESPAGGGTLLAATLPLSAG